MWVGKLLCIKEDLFKRQFLAKLLKFSITRSHKFNGYLQWLTSMVNYKSIIGIYTYALTLNKTYLSVSSYLKNENNLVIQKADKGNTIVILDKDSYLKSVETLLKDSSKFKNILYRLIKT